MNTVVFIILFVLIGEIGYVLGFITCSILTAGNRADQDSERLARNIKGGC